MNSFIICKKIILIGYMGSGKSAVGNELGKIMRIPAIDLDKLIESNAEISVSQIFKINGEIYFRKLENRILTEQLNSDESFILSLGGGTPCFENNQFIFQDTEVIVFYLKASVDTLYNRLIKENKTRPLIKSLKEEELKEFITKHLFERNQYYYKANHSICVDDKSISDIALEIISKLA